jgi:Tfp pilus assembly protein PilO
MKLDNRQKVLSVVAAAAAALYLGDLAIVGPLTNLWNERAKQIKTLRDQVREGLLYQRRAPSLRADWEQMRKNALPNNSSAAPEMVSSAMQDWAQDSNASLNNTTPQWKEFDGYRTLVCRVDISGSMWNLSRFLHDIENSPMALKIESLDLSSKDNSGQTLTLSLNVSGLVLTPNAK